MGQVVFLDLLRIRQPFHAILSITHRICGVVMLLLLPVWTYGLYVLRYASLDTWLYYTSSVWIQGILYISGIVLVGHTMLGIRHILSDAGYIAYQHHVLSGIVTLMLWGGICIGWFICL